MLWKTIAILSFMGILLALWAPRIAGAQAGGGAIDAVDVMKASATIEKIDLDKRKVTLIFDDGKKKTVKADKRIRNLDQVKVGDHVNVQYAEEIVVAVGETKESVGAGDAGLVAIAPKGSEPGGVMVDTESLTAKVVSVDAAKHRVVLLEPDGKKRNIKLGKKVTNLDKLKPGETVDMVVTEALAVEVTH